MCATWYEGKAQLLRFTEYRSHLLAETIIRWRMGGNRSTRRKPLTNFRKCHILKPKNSCPIWDSKPHSSTGGRLGKQPCEPLHHASLFTYYQVLLQQIPSSALWRRSCGVNHRQDPWFWKAALHEFDMWRAPSWSVVCCDLHCNEACNNSYL